MRGSSGCLAESGKHDKQRAKPGRGSRLSGLEVVEFSPGSDYPTLRINLQICMRASPRLLHSPQDLNVTLLKTFVFLLCCGLLFVGGRAVVDVSGDFQVGRQALILGNSSDAIARFDRAARREPNYVTGSGALRQSIWTYLGRAQYQGGQFAAAQGSFEKALQHSSDDSMARLYLGLTLLRQPAAAKAANPFTLQEVSYALREGIEPKRVAILARERGLDFELTKESESELKKAGADEMLLGDFRKIRGEITQRGGSATQATKELATALAGLRDSFNYTIAHTPQGKFWDPYRGDPQADSKRPNVALHTAARPAENHFHRRIDRTKIGRGS
jgi:tetratricopeptide (TPR) repeat protein